MSHPSFSCIEQAYQECLIWGKIYNQRNSNVTGKSEKAKKESATTSIQLLKSVLKAQYEKMGCEAVWCNKMCTP